MPLDGRLGGGIEDNYDVNTLYGILQRNGHFIIKNIPTRM